ncbi:uncharacterized protein BJ171DRAFT_599499 [Polychytrium aggregatum]|uniref:uncharacterized protein n=1 Tax=Polychytrium aggregatum TaxID=110093 RepID=UPI0022FE5952|nr:uncharacterized protein BJ171DRAFT_599499 [Polychytrium aggregatum]KAI9203948.1 hypothetical protein BJ171DRAFT_599499 [Polychytrium aggregatum]
MTSSMATAALEPASKPCKGKTAKVFQLITPAANRFLQQKWDMARHQRHLDRLNEIKPAIDNKTPAEFREQKKKDAKRMQREAERAAEIHQGNIKILKKISNMVQKQHEEWKGMRTLPQEINPFEHIRQKQLKKIKEENIRHLEKIEVFSSQSNYSKEKFDSDWSETERHLERISLYPIVLSIPHSRSTATSKYTTPQSSRPNSGRQRDSESSLMLSMGEHSDGYGDDGGRSSDRKESDWSCSSHAAEIHDADESLASMSIVSETNLRPESPALISIIVEQE